jgi:putative flippase GtrA
MNSPEPAKVGRAWGQRLWATRHQPATRWLATGLVFMGITSFILYLSVDIGGLSVAVGSVVAAEVATLLRFWVNEFWVFRSRSPSWMKLGQFHIANAGATAVWWVATNLLDRAGLNHLLASILAVGFSTGISMGVNFLWIWRKQPEPATKP